MKTQTKTTKQSKAEKMIPQSYLTTKDKAAPSKVADKFAAAIESESTRYETAQGSQIESLLFESWLCAPRVASDGTVYAIAKMRAHITGRETRVGARKFVRASIRGDVNSFLKTPLTNMNRGKGFDINLSSPRQNP